MLYTGNEQKKIDWQRILSIYWEIGMRKINATHNIEKNTD